MPRNVTFAMIKTFRAALLWSIKPGSSQAYADCVYSVVKQLEELQRFY